jgi:general stress protein 26
MDEAVKNRILRAKELLSTAQNAAMATVNEDGSPHNTPFFFMRDDTFQHIYWSSHPDSLHSKNVVRTGQIFVVLYDMMQGGGLFIKAGSAAQVDDMHLDQALMAHNTARARVNKEPLSREYYVQPQGQRMYSATTTHFYVNNALRDNEGHIIKDMRVEVSAMDLLF